MIFQLHSNRRNCTAHSFDRIDTILRHVPYRHNDIHSPYMESQPKAFNIISDRVTPYDIIKIPNIDTPLRKNLHYRLLHSLRLDDFYTRHRISSVPYEKHI